MISRRAESRLGGAAREAESVPRARRDRSSAINVDVNAKRLSRQQRGATRSDEDKFIIDILMILPPRALSSRTIGDACFLNGPISVIGYRACRRRGQGQPRSMRATLTRRWMRGRGDTPRGERYRWRRDVTSKWKVRGRQGRAGRAGRAKRARGIRGAQSPSG